MKAASGFTLVETVVALAILALVAGVVYESFGWSLRRTAAVEKREVAWLIAQSVLADIRGRNALQIGTERGKAVGLDWEARIGRYEHRIEAAEVTIDVRWGEGAARHVTLRSVETAKVTP
jgi:prepilin-type N-terminal cleavage/methylation domain-containing protein